MMTKISNETQRDFVTLTDMLTGVTGGTPTEGFNGGWRHGPGGPPIERPRGCWDPGPRYRPSPRSWWSPPWWGFRGGWWRY